MEYISVNNKRYYLLDLNTKLIKGDIYADRITLTYETIHNSIGYIVSKSPLYEKGYTKFYRECLNITPKGNRL